MLKLVKHYFGNYILEQRLDILMEPMAPSGLCATYTEYDEYPVRYKVFLSREQVKRIKNMPDKEAVEYVVKFIQTHKEHVIRV